MGALPEVVCMRDRGWEESVQDMSRIGYYIHISTEYNVAITEYIQTFAVTRCQIIKQ